VVDEKQDDEQIREETPCPVCGVVGHEVRRIGGQRVVICPSVQNHPMGPILPGSLQSDTPPFAPGERARIVPPS
jgi:hypothetical protein